MAKELPYFKFEPSAWDNGRIQLLSFQEQGVFINLCALYWQRLGDLSYALALRKGCGGDELALHALCDNDIIRIEEQNLVIDFLDEQLLEFDQISDQNRKNALSGWEKRKKKATAKQPQSNRKAIREEKKREEERRREKINYPWPTENFISIWGRWKDYKKSQFNFKYKTPSTEQAALTELNKLAADELTAIQIIHQSMGNGWKGFFKLKNGTNGQSNDYSETILKFAEQYGPNKTS